MDLPDPFRLAKRVSLESDYRVQMGAALVIGKNVIKGTNKIKTHPIYGYSIHAEMDCLIKSKNYDIIGSEMYIYRDINGEPALARPCKNCMKMLKEVGISVVYFTIEIKPYYRMEIIN